MCSPNTLLNYDKQWKFSCHLQQFWAMNANLGADQSHKYEWFTEEGRLNMIGVSNETVSFINETTN